MSALSYQDQLQAQPEQDETRGGPDVVSFIAICIAVLSLGFTLGTIVTRHQYNGVIANYQTSLDEAAKSVRRANELLRQVPQLTPYPTTPCVGKSCQTPPPPPYSRPPTPAPTTAPKSTPPPMIAKRIPTVQPSATAYGDVDPDQP